MRRENLFKGNSVCLEVREGMASWAGRTHMALGSQSTGSQAASASVEIGNQDTSLPSPPPCMIH